MMNHPSTSADRPAEHRGASRNTLDGHAQVLTFSVRQAAMIRDLSFSGCYLEMRPPPDVGTAVSLRLVLGVRDGFAIMTNGRVVRKSESGCGIRFAYIDAQAPRAIKDWLKTAASALRSAGDPE